MLGATMAETKILEFPVTNGRRFEDCTLIITIKRHKVRILPKMKGYGVIHGDYPLSPIIGQCP
jgi:hypothetical protein